MDTPQFPGVQSQDVPKLGFAQGNAATNKTKSNIRADSLRRADELMDFLIDRIKRLSELHQMEDLKPVAAEAAIARYIGIVVKLLNIRQQFVDETDERSDLLRRFLTADFARKEE